MLNASRSHRGPPPISAFTGAWASGIVERFKRGGFVVVAAHNKSVDRMLNGGAGGCAPARLTAPLNPGHLQR